MRRWISVADVFYHLESFLFPVLYSFLCPLFHNCINVSESKKKARKGHERTGKDGIIIKEATKQLQS